MDVESIEVLEYDDDEPVLASLTDEGSAAVTCLAVSKRHVIVGGLSDCLR